MPRLKKMAARRNFLNFRRCVHRYLGFRRCVHRLYTYLRGLAHQASPQPLSKEDGLLDIREIREICGEK